VLAHALAQDDLVLRAFEGDFEEFRSGRLGDEVAGVELEPLHGHVHVAVAGDQDDLGVRAFGLDAAQQFQAVHAGHPHIGKHDGRAFAAEDLQGLIAIGGHEHLVAHVGQGDADHLADAGFVVDKQYVHEYLTRSWRALPPNGRGSSSPAKEHSADPSAAEGEKAWKP